MKNNLFSLNISNFHGRQTPKEGVLVGYGALIEAFDLSIPIPTQLAWISTKKRQYTTEHWLVLTSRHKPEDTLYKQLIFALKYEGVNLLFFKKLFQKLNKTDVIGLISTEPTGQYSRRIWFLYEWLMQKKLPVEDLKMGNFVLLIDNKIQYGLNEGVRSSRHRILNNLPGTVDFCPLIHKTKKLREYLEKDITSQHNIDVNRMQKEVIQRASAFLLLKDSKASFTIEGESPKSKRAARWGQAIGQAGTKKLSHEELARLQQIVIENPRFLAMGYRKQGGFIGKRDRDTFSPLPDHISARHEDISTLMNGWLQSCELLMNSDFDAVLAASSLAFGFVFIHPFVDGNGRIHRYLIHHVLATRKCTPQGIIFPVSASILDKIQDYQKVLESYSLPLLDFIEWKETASHNLKVTNDTIDFYRYYDATIQAEFLYDCMNDTIVRIIPAEVEYLMRYDEFKSFIDNHLEMPDDLVALLVRFLERGNGVLSKRAREKEFVALTPEEAGNIEEQYKLIFLEK